MANDIHAQQSKHDWSHPGIKTFTYKNGSNKWDTWGKFILSAALGALAWSFAAGGKSRDISELLTWKGETQETLKRMDKDGTNRSHWVDEAQSNQIAANQAEIAKVKEKTEQITVLQGKFERLEQQFDDYKALHK